MARGSNTGRNNYPAGRVPGGSKQVIEALRVSSRLGSLTGILVPPSIKED